jgi:nicotinate-nucleotide pyrophosphorylase (carboxylating)
VVSGAWKKMPFPIKELVRQAVVDGGIHYRISEKPFLYLDKNYLKMLGGVEKALRSVDRLKGFVKVIQIKSQSQMLVQEATQAVRMGAHIIMIDTGRGDDIDKVDAVLRHHRLRHRVKIAFGGEISIEDLRDLKRAPVEIVDIGKAIVDAPLLDMRLDVVGKV